MSDHNPLFPRASGILLHPTSLPGRCGVGNLGAPARRFVDWLADAGQSWWQVLPLGPTTWGDSPYQTLSAFAGNPLLIDPDPFVADGWLTPDDLGASPPFPVDHVDFGRVQPFVNDLLDRACDRFQVLATAAQRAEHDAWVRAQAPWLKDWALYAALKEAQDGRPWHAWPAPLARRDPAALTAARSAHAALVARHRFRQWVFHRQWSALRDYAQARGVRLLGDVPIFVAHDSADVWAHRELFQLDDAGQPTVVAGVPPDYFSKTGQRWGNPLYRWDALRACGYDWWIARFRQALALVDAVRIDHFRGFAANWEIPAAEPTAVKGRWVPGPGADLFHAVRRALGALPIVAEDLGVITPDVEALRDDLDLPGMKVLQFAWSDPRNPFLPHAHVPNAVVYSGTHDNNTTVGWWCNETDARTRAFLANYLGRTLAEIDREPHWTLLRLGMMSPAHTFIATLQDVLGLGPEARLNTPASADGNWSWRALPEQFDDPAVRRLADWTRLYRRRADQQTPDDDAEEPA